MKRLLPVIIIALSLAFSLFLVMTKKAPQRRKDVKREILVKTEHARPAGPFIPIAVTGTVSPRYVSDLSTQVSAPVTWVNPRFIKGEFFKKGDLLFKIDDTDFKSALEEAKARLTRAKLDLEIIKARARIAKKEWELHEHEPGERPLPLVFYRPQHENAKQLVEAARAAVKKALIDLERTKVKAPFDCYVKEEAVEAGHYVHSGSKVAELVYSGEAEVVLPLQEEYLAIVDSRNRNGKGSEVHILVPGTGKVFKGWVDRIAPFVNNKTRMADCFVLVKDPFCQNSRDSCIPLSIGAFVEAVIKAHAPDKTFVIPERALKGLECIYVLNPQGLLERKRIKVIHMDRDRVWVQGPLRAGDPVVTSPVDEGLIGMRVSIFKGD